MRAYYRVLTVLLLLFILDYRVLLLYGSHYFEKLYGALISEISIPINITGRAASLTPYSVRLAIFLFLGL